MGLVSSHKDKVVLSYSHLKLLFPTLFRLAPKKKPYNLKLLSASHRISTYIHNLPTNTWMQLLISPPPPIPLQVSPPLPTLPDLRLKPIPPYPPSASVSLINPSSFSLPPYITISPIPPIFLLLSLAQLVISAPYINTTAMTNTYVTL